MEVIHTIEELQKKLKTFDKTIGFVPTMGYLHEGHLSLVEQARQENDIVVMSIFVNPLQFGPNEDFDRYPRDEERDTQLAKKHGVDYLFIPSVEEMYPENGNIVMTVKNKANVLCGRSREGHFDGVITVLTKLFHIVSPENAYFGMKDAQQLAIVETLVKELNFPLNIVGLSTVREADGLAKSSRNVYLSDSERKEALSLYNGLQIGQKLIVDGTRNPDTIINEVKNYLSTKTSGQVDYVELLSYPNLEEVNEINQSIILALAVRYNNARLIDNFILTQNGELVQRVN